MTISSIFGAGLILFIGLFISGVFKGTTKTLTLCFSGLLSLYVLLDIKLQQHQQLSAFLFFAGFLLFVFWSLQFYDLLLRKDSFFPGNHDKLLWWALFLILPMAAPFFYIFFKSAIAVKQSTTDNLYETS